MAADRDWDRLAEFVRERRVELGMTQEDVRAAGGPSTATMRLIEGALQQSYQPATLRDLERALRWERGSARAILGGGGPVPAGGGGPPSQPAAVIPDLKMDDVIPAMSPQMRTAAQPYHDEIAAALGIASAVESVPAEHLRGEQVFGQGSELARLWDYAMDAGTALFGDAGYPVGARTWMVAIALVRRDERRAHGGEAAGLCALIRG